MPLSLAHFIEKFWSTTPRTVEIQNSLFCRSRWWFLHCSCEFFRFVPFSHYFSFFIAYKRTSIQQKKSKIQPASLSSGSASSSLQWKWFLDWNCYFLQTCLAPDISSLVSVSPHLEWQAPAVCQCWVTAAGGIYVGKPFTIKRCVSKVYVVLNFIFMSKGFIITNSLFKLPGVRDSDALSVKFPMSYNFPEGWQGTATAWLQLAFEKEPRSFLQLCSTEWLMLLTVTRVHQSPLVATEVAMKCGNPGDREGNLELWSCWRWRDREKLWE